MPEKCLFHGEQQHTYFNTYTLELECVLVKSHITMDSSLLTVFESTEYLCEPTEYQINGYCIVHQLKAQ